MNESGRKVFNERLQSIYVDWTEKELRTRLVRLRPVVGMTSHGGHGGGHARDRAVRVTWQSHARSDLVRVVVKFLYRFGIYSEHSLSPADPEEGLGK